MLLSNVKKVSRAGFGATRVTPGVDIPARLDALHARLPTGYGVSLDALIDKHTAYPYYSSFLSPERAQKAREALRLGDARIAMSSLGMQRELPTTSLLRSEEHTSELQSLMRISYAVFCLKKKIKIQKQHKT